MRLSTDLTKVRKRAQKNHHVIYMRIKSEPSWGIAEDMIFGAAVENGVLLELGFVPETEAKSKAEFILTATPQEWKSV